MNNHKTVLLDAGLHFVATPLGNARDITLRALDVLASADVLAAEDTRTLRRLMDIHGIDLAGRPLIAYHDHNGAAVRPRLISMMNDGKSVAYASEAGTPVVADPGFTLARDALEAGVFVTGAPGPSAAIHALSLSGLPSDRFLFAGFLPTGQKARKEALAALKDTQATLILYESPKRIHQTLAAMCEVFGADRNAAVARELTKKFEEVRRGTLGDLVAQLEDITLKGEIVLLVERGSGEVGEVDIEEMLSKELKRQSVRDAVDSVVAATGAPRRKVYQMALKMGSDS